MQKLKEKKGITLIALIVTIVVLIILAGITISAIMGNNGIITKAQYAANETTKAGILEEINRTWLELMTGTDFLQLKVEKQAERFQTELRGEDESATATVDETDDTKINVFYKGIETIIDTQGGTKDWIDNGGSTGGGSTGGGNTGTGTGGSSGTITPGSYLVRFNSNGGSGVTAQHVAPGGYAVKPESPTRPEYSFVGWYSDANLTYEFDFSKKITRGMILYAKWKENPTIYQVVFNANGRSGVEGQSIKYRNKVTKPENPVRDGWSFVSWYSDSNLTQKFDFNTEVTSNLVLTAKWYEITEGEIFTWSTTASEATLLGFSDLGKEQYKNGVIVDITVPETYSNLDVTTIGSGAFSNYSNITYVDIPDTVTTIGSRAFYGCIALQGIWDFSDKLTSIEENTFYNCKLIAGECDLSNITSIGSYAFYNCANITGDFTLSDKITYIVSSTFYNCVGLTGETSLTENVTSIGTYAFYNCTGLTSIDMPNTISQIGSYAFNNCVKLGAIVVPYQATIGEKAFYAVKEIHYDGKSSGSPWGASKVTKCNNVTFTTTKAVTCQTRGSGYYDCDVLGGRVNVTLIELNHTPNFVNDVCTICGYKRRWENTANGDTFKFTRNGATWTSNNRGVPLSTAMSTWEANLEEAEVYTLKYRVSSEQDKDILKITLDGETIVTASGNGSEVAIQLNLSEGKHTLVATYEKDSLNDSNNDNAYIVLYK